MLRLLSLLALVSAAFSSAAIADTDIAKACGTLNRPNIDCACVAKRMDVMKNATESVIGKQVLEHGYLWSVNLENKYIDKTKQLQKDGLSFADFDQDMDTFGGRPDEITDYEAGCAIQNAEKPELPVAQPGSVVSGLTKLCEGQGDSGKKRFCACYSHRKSLNVTAPELEAHYRGYADWLGKDIKSAAQKNKSHASIMGLSDTAYDTLMRSANKKIDAAANRDNNYCEAMLWADNEDGSPRAQRERGGFSDDVLKKLKNRSKADIKKVEAFGKVAQAEAIINAACKSEGKSDAQCACTITDFRSSVVAKAQKPDHAYGWAVMRFGDQGMAQTDFLKALQSLSPADQMAAGQLLGTTPDIGLNCQKQKGSSDTKGPKSFSGDATQRMNKICESDGTPKAMCECTTNSMKSSMGADDFELIVDIREAEHLGYDDPMAKVAEDRGLTKDEAEQAMMMNKQLMGGMMSMDLMSCMSDMSKFMPQ